MLEIRRYQDTDNSAVWELHHLALASTGAFFRDGKWDADLLDIHNHYINNRGEFLVGVFDHKIVCMGAFRNKSDTVAEIKRMRVHPDYQRRGFGQTVLSKLEEKACRFDIKNCVWTLPQSKYPHKNFTRKIVISKYVGNNCRRLN